MVGGPVRSGPFGPDLLEEPHSAADRLTFQSRANRPCGGCWTG